MKFISQEGHHFFLIFFSKNMQGTEGDVVEGEMQKMRRQRKLREKREKLQVKEISFIKC